MAQKNSFVLIESCENSFLYIANLPWSTKNLIIFVKNPYQKIPPLYNAKQLVKETVMRKKVGWFLILCKEEYNAYIIRDYTV